MNKIYKLEEWNSLMKGYKEQCALTNARNAWYWAMEEYIDKQKEIGSCVRGDGIMIDVLFPRKRKPIPVTIISSPFQGSCVNESTYHIALNILKKNGIEAYYNYGSLD